MIIPLLGLATQELVLHHRVREGGNEERCETTVRCSKHGARPPKQLKNHSCASRTTYDSQHPMTRR
ncbi:hypothetical protein LINPERHAP1_LOCUS40924 [Linum perenne]